MSLAVAGDPVREAFDRFRKHDSHVRAIVLGIVRDENRAEDVMQEAYVVALGRGDRVKDPRAARSARIHASWTTSSARCSSPSRSRAIARRK